MLRNDSLTRFLVLLGEQEARVWLNARRHYYSQEEIRQELGEARQLALALLNDELHAKL